MSTAALGPQAQVLLGPGPSGPIGLPSGVNHDPYLTTNQRNKREKERKEEKRKERKGKQLHVDFCLRIQII